MTLTITSRGALAEARLPVTELAAQMRLPDGWEAEPHRSARFADALRAAVDTVERRSGQALLTRETVLEGRAPGGRLLTLPIAPVAEVVSLTAGGAAVALSGAVIERDGGHTRLCLARALVAGAAIRIVVNAGVGEWHDLASGLCEAVLLEAEAHEGGGLAVLQAAASRMIAPYRTLRLGRG